MHGAIVEDDFQHDGVALDGSGQAFASSTSGIRRCGAEGQALDGGHSAKRALTKLTFA